jgi:hypothetical protein
MAMPLTQQDRYKIRQNKRQQTRRKDQNMRAEEKPRIKTKANYNQKTM